MPYEYGSYKTAWRRHKTWSWQGVFKTVWRHTLGLLEHLGAIDWEHCSMDGSLVQAKRGVNSAR